jgi:mannose-1-phosphate guanylyltransferase/mannose-6-phosphate isomerase
MTYAVILAGGWGERLWPLSTRQRPKQLLDLVGEGGSLLADTLARVGPMVSVSDTIIMTSASLDGRIAEAIPSIPGHRIIGEPVGKNTAPAIALAAHLLLREDADALTVVLPADHVVKDAAAFQSAIRTAIEAAEHERGLVTLGIRPTRPETEYGYIRAGAAAGVDGVVVAASFEEKPDRETAAAYVERGGYYWNSGMFVWRADRFLEEVRLYLPEVASALDGVTSSPGEASFARELDAYYAAVPGISVDYGVMEKARRVLMVPAEFGWDDVGAWPALKRIWPTDASGNVAKGDAVVLDSSGCVVYAETGIVAVIGLENVVVVRTENATLVVPAERARDVRDVVRLLKQRQEEGH